MPIDHPGTPPLTSANALLLWLARRQRLTLVIAVLFGVARNLSTAAIPLVLGRALDAGLTDGLSAATWWGAGAVLLVGVAATLTSAYGHLFETLAWVYGTFHTGRLVGHHVTRIGPNVTRRAATGEVVATITNDTFHIGNVFEMAQRFVGSLAGVLFVALVLLRSSVVLGVVVLVGMPLVSVLVALLVRPLQTRQRVQREAQGRLGALATDTVAGLRVLRGIGGEDVFTDRYATRSQEVRAAGVSVATIAASMRGLQVLLPGLFVAFVVWFGAHLALSGEMSPGDLVALFGYTTYLAAPLQAFTQFIQLLVRARVGADKVIRVVGTGPSAGTLAESEAADERPWPAPATTGARLVDPTSGFVAEAGTFVAVVSDPPEDANALAARLGRLLDPERSDLGLVDPALVPDASEPLPGPDRPDADRPGTDRSPATLDGTPVDRLPVAEVRERVVVAGSTPELFAGTLRETLDVRDRGDDDELLGALAAADAQDVLDSVGGTLDGEIAEKGRSLSGGQRQRVALARALLTEAPALVLVEPTSAVDAHTEARISATLAARRAGRTTVVVTTSPLVLEHADSVAFLDGGRVTAHAPHTELARRAHEGDPAARRYRSVVTRTTADDEQEAVR
ncbi:ABC transporter transmembrane domain-containing protein [Georgenia sp. Z1344]|uniref:ABC transporter transmembrane domain-containing protein n=1 Tax=Georgenia sp. Z1344 TaxID=3416706 RepID=UPI003CECC936